jgi:hypothetical protein
MTQYTTKAFTVGEVTVTASRAKSGSAADRLEAVLKWLGEMIGAGLPDNALPGDPKPDNTLPGTPAAPDQGLPPTSPGAPDQGLPGAQPGVDNELPLEDLADFLTEHAKEIAAAILKGTACDPAQPKT